MTIAIPKSKIQLKKKGGETNEKDDPYIGMRSLDAS